MKRLLPVLAVLLPITAYGLTMEEAVNTALKNNYDILITQRKVRSAQMNIKSKKRSNFGKVIFKGSYTRYNIPRTLTPIVPPIISPVPSDRDIGNLGIAYTVNIFSGFSKIEDVKIANLEKKLAEDYLQLSKSQIAYNVRSIYLKILSLKENRSALSSYINALNTLKKNIKLGIKTGKRPEIDLLKVEAEIERINTEIETINGNIKTLRSALAFLMGKKEIGTLEPVKKAPDVRPDTNISKNIRIKIAKLQLEKSKKYTKKLKASYFPSINLDAYYGKNYGAGESAKLWQIGISFNWLVFDFGSREAKLEMAKEVTLSSKLEVEREKLSLQKSLTEALAKIETAKERIKGIEKELEFARKVKEIEKVRYDTGAGTIYDLLNAEAKFESAKSRLITAKYDLLDAIYYLKFVKGEVK
ncbi:TolC family protein [Desulfurobacterium sp.]|uniref:TolC family protein n=1 Tax=Desulfurobacterium sp. TaxID=2004706 RepID=UPI00260AEE04|nr:TolC family protein [Desulfurobacterium sp.]